MLSPGDYVQVRKGSQWRCGGLLAMVVNHDEPSGNVRIELVNTDVEFSIHWVVPLRDLVLVSSEVRTVQIDYKESSNVFKG